MQEEKEAARKANQQDQTLCQHPNQRARGEDAHNCILLLHTAAHYCILLHAAACSLRLVHTAACSLRLLQIILSDRLKVANKKVLSERLAKAEISSDANPQLASVSTAL